MTDHAPTTPGQVIVARGIFKTYADEAVQVRALRGVDLDIEAGEFTALVGPSGSGKTTFLNIIAGLDRASAGETWLAGVPMSSMSGNALSDFRRDHIGFIFQAYNLIPVLTVAENVDYIMVLQGVANAERRRRVAEALDAVGLADMQTRLPPQLSGGQQQRVAIARAIVSRPALILADEPTANLDSQTGGGLLDMMRHLNDSTGMTFLFSTHDPMVMERARRIVTLRDGRVEKDQRKS